MMKKLNCVLLVFSLFFLGCNGGGVAAAKPAQPSILKDGTISTVYNVNLERTVASNSDKDKLEEDLKALYNQTVEKKCASKVGKIINKPMRLTSGVAPDYLPAIKMEYNFRCYK